MDDVRKKAVVLIQWPNLRVSESDNVTQGVELLATHGLYMLQNLDRTLAQRLKEHKWAL